MPRSQTVTVSPPAPPPPPPSTLFPQPAPRHHSPPLTSLVDPASVVQPDSVLENGFSDCLNGPPVHIHHPVQPMTPIHPQLMPNLGASCCGENLLGTWFQTPHIGDGRIPIPELQGFVLSISLVLFLNIDCCSHGTLTNLLFISALFAYACVLSGGIHGARFSLV